MYQIEGASMEFNDVFKLLSYYQDYPINESVACIGECFKPLKRKASALLHPSGIISETNDSRMKMPPARSRSQSFSSQRSFDDVSYR